MLVEETPMKKIARYRLGLGAAAFAIAFLAAAYLPSEDLLGSKGIDLHTLRLGYALYWLAQVAGYAVFGLLTDRRASTKQLLTVSVGIGIIAACFALDPLPGTIIASRLLAGFAAGAMTTLFAVASDALFAVVAGSLLGAFGGIVNVVLLPTVASPVQLVMILLCLGCVLGMSTVSTKRTPRLASSMSQPLVLLLVLTFFSAGSFSAFIQAEVNMLMLMKFEHQTTLWLLFAVIYSLSGACVLLFSRTRIGEKKKAAALGIALVMSAASFTLPAVSPLLLPFALFGGMLAMSFVDIFWAGLINRFTPVREQGAAMSLALTVGTIGRAVLPAVIVFAAPSIQTSFLVCAASAATAACLTQLFQNDGVSP